MLTPQRWQQVKELLGPALELDPAKRTDYLNEACGHDASLRSDVGQFLVADQEAGTGFLNAAALHLKFPAALPEHKGLWIGRRLGPYEIVEKIDVGGMGEVYRCLRSDDEYHKEVAIKLVRSGRDSHFVLNRFKKERQILASLDHPNIARLLDGGTTEEGVPYFVMELIKGEKISNYCDAHKLSTIERLKLFLEVCSAVQYAHQCLIIHRDLKPSNILVTAEGLPKLLDFGIAKILELNDDATDEVEQTISLVRLLTPEYASPEQVKGEPITTASDVYSLGVVLYELLAGRHPYRSPDTSPEKVASAIRDTEPEKPSTAVLRSGDSQVSATPFQPGEGSREKVSRMLRGDLDNIVLMTLRKEPQRRYASAEQLAVDIRRYLGKLPVAARRDTARYRASKFVARHKVGVVTTTIVALTLIVGLVGTLEEARIAQRRFNDVRSLANSLILDVYDSIEDLPGSTSARKMIVDRALQYLNRLAEESRGDLGLQRELATAYERMGDVQGNPRFAKSKAIASPSGSGAHWRMKTVALSTIR